MDLFVTDWVPQCYLRTARFLYLQFADNVLSMLPRWSSASLSLVRSESLTYQSCFTDREENNINDNRVTVQILQCRTDPRTDFLWTVYVCPTLIQHHNASTKSIALTREQYRYYFVTMSRRREDHSANSSTDSRSNFELEFLPSSTTLHVKCA